MRLAGPQPRALDLRPGSNVALLLGDNACGKTTFLDAAAYALDAFVSGMTGSPLRRIPASDVHIDAEGRMAEEMGIRWRLTTPAGEALEACITRSGAGRARKSSLGGIRSYAASLREEGATLPVAAYYGTGRGHIKASLGNRPFRRAQSRTDCYRHALDPSSPLRGLFRWFALMEDFERKRGEALRDPERTLPQLDAVRRAAGVFVGDRFHSPRIASRDTSRESPLLINPAEDDPARHIVFHDEIAVPRPSGGGEDPRGRYTIDTMRLNSRPDLVENRLRLLCRYRTMLQARRLAEELVRRGLEPVRGRGLLEAAEAAIREMESPSGEYSAMLRQGHPESRHKDW